MRLPENVKEVMAALRSGGFEAYAVGGCVRDHLLGRTPKDYDIATNASPGEMLRAFKGFRVIATGLAHGTVTAMTDGGPVEVTAFRTDGEYADSRRPRSVSFTQSLSDDLSRRDFTINAMAFSPQTGIIDPFGGREDLEKKLVRCVGAPKERFGEDGLRIMRALRFAAALCFDIEPGTKKAAFAFAEILRKISAERLREELCGLISGPCAAKTIDGYTEILAVFLPELSALKRSRPDDFRAALAALPALPPDPVLRLCALLHRAGETGGILRRLRFDKKSAAGAELLSELMDAPLPQNDCELKRLLARAGYEGVSGFLALRRAFLTARDEKSTEKIAALERRMEEILALGECFSLSGLKINGSDLIALGFSPGPGMKAVLSELLDDVCSGRIENSPDALLEKARALLGSAKGL